MLFMLCSIEFQLDTFFNMGHSSVKENKLAGFIRLPYIVKIKLPTPTMILFTTAPFEQANGFLDS